MAAPGTDVDTLYTAAAPRMVALAWMLLGRREHAEDAVHDAFATLAARDLDDVRQPEAYLRTAVVNECRRVMRQRTRERGTPVEAPPHLDRSDVEMHDALAGLSPRRRTAIVLRFYEDMAVTDIADLLGCRPSTVSSLLHRGLRDLREVIIDAD